MWQYWVSDKKLDHFACPKISSNKPKQASLSFGTSAATLRWLLLSWWIHWKVGHVLNLCPSVSFMATKTLKLSGLTLKKWRDNIWSKFLWKKLEFQWNWFKYLWNFLNSSWVIDFYKLSLNWGQIHLKNDLYFFHYFKFKFLIIIIILRCIILRSKM